MVGAMLKGRGSPLSVYLASAAALGMLGSLDEALALVLNGVLRRERWVQ